MISVAADALQWANMLLVPVVGLLFKISTQLAALQATQAAHADRLGQLERARA